MVKKYIAQSFRQHGKSVIFNLFVDINLFLESMGHEKSSNSDKANT